MNGLLVQRRRAHGDCDIGRYSNVVGVKVDVAYIRPCTGRIPCNRSMMRVPGGIVCTQVYWRVRVFGPSGIIDRLYEGKDKKMLVNIIASGILKMCCNTGAEELKYRKANVC